MKWIKVGIAISCICILFSSCTLLKVRSGEGVMMYVHNPQEYEVVKHFKILLPEQRLLFGLLKLKDPSGRIGPSIEQEIKNFEGDAAIIKAITYKEDFLGASANYLSRGIVKYRIIQIEGQVINFKKSE